MAFAAPGCHLLSRSGDILNGEERPLKKKNIYICYFVLQSVFFWINAKL